jgi:Gpi18-like mannosyltransferase
MQMKKIIYIIIVAIVVKAFYICSGITFNELNDIKVSSYNITNQIDFFQKNDSYWYEKIAINGHHKITPDQLGKCDTNYIEQSYYEFLPLYPFTIRASMLLLNIDFKEVAFLYSIVFSLAAFILFYLFAKTYTNDEDKAFWGTMILILFPFHYYFSMFYTESLFLILLIGCFMAINANKILILSVLLALLALVRPNGIFMIIPLFIYFIEKHYSLDLNKLFKRNIREYLPLLAFLCAPIALLAYCVYLKYMTGDFFAYITARRGWCLYSTFPWEPMLRMEKWEDYFKFGYLMFYLLISLIYIKKIPLSMQALIWINILLPLTSNMMTLPRFISSIFIFSIIFGMIISKFRKPYIIGILIILFIGQLFTFTFWLMSHEFSY